MAGKYLGEFDHEVIVPDTFEKQQKWALMYIGSYAGIDGGHHKDWVFDQVARIMHGTPIETKVAKWDCGTQDLRFNLREPTQSYHDWVAELCDGEDGPNTYGYDIGSAP